MRHERGKRLFPAIDWVWNVSERPMWGRLGSQLWVFGRWWGLVGDLLVTGGVASNGMVGPWPFSLSLSLFLSLFLHHSDEMDTPCVHLITSPKASGLIDHGVKALKQ
jgi:hypothetical protein